MNRRQLLSSLFGSAAVLGVGEFLLPSTRTIFLPPRGGWWGGPRHFEEKPVGPFNAWDTTEVQRLSRYSLHRTSDPVIFTFDEPPPAGAQVRIEFDGAHVRAYVDGEFTRINDTDALLVTSDFQGVHILM